MIVLKAIGSALFWLFLAVWTVVEFIPFFFIHVLILPFDRNLSFAQWITTVWGVVCFGVNPGWKLEIEGRERLRQGGPYVIAPNHESLGDILVLFQLRTHFKWISKRSIMQIPFLGWAMALAGDIPLVRGSKESIARCMRKAAWWLRRGVSIMIFPEGTRSKSGKLRAFKVGAFRLSLDTGRPILPVVLTGTYRVLPRDTWIFRETTRMRMRVLQPIDPAPFMPNDVEGFMRVTRAAMAAVKAELEGRDPREVVE